MKQFVNDYLQISKKERRGYLVLLALVALIFIAPALLPRLMKQYPKPMGNELQEQLAALSIEKDTTTTGGKRRYYEHRQSYNKYKPVKHYEWEDEEDEPATAASELFYFDPNTLSAAGWLKLGVRKKTIETIENYLAKGGKFYKPADIKRIYGLPPQIAEALEPYIQIAVDSSRYRPRYTDSGFAARAPAYKSTTIVLDINEADTSDFKRLPGIGSGLARRIVNFRDKLGGFYSVDQVKETHFLPDSVFQQIKAQLACKPPTTGKINVNTADTALLRRHPYIDRHLAHNLVAYRQQHGPFATLADLKKLRLMRDEIYERLLPYLTLE